MQQKFIKKCIRFLLQNATVLLQNATVITNIDDFITKCDSYYKMLRLLQIATVQRLYQSFVREHATNLKKDSFVAKKS